MEFPQWLVDRVINRQGRLHPYDSFDAARTAFVIVDLQNYCTQPDYLGECAPARAIPCSVQRNRKTVDAGQFTLRVKDCGVAASALWVVELQRECSCTELVSSGSQPLTLQRIMVLITMMEGEWARFAFTLRGKNQRLQV